MGVQITRYSADLKKEVYIKEYMCMPFSTNLGSKYEEIIKSVTQQIK